MLQSVSFKLALLFLTSSLVLASCSPGVQENPRVQNQSLSTASIKVGGQTTFSQIPYRLDGNGKVWIPVEQAAESFDFNHEWDPQAGTFRMGYRDILYQVTVDKPSAQQVETVIQLPDAPRLMEGKPYITIDSLGKLWDTQVNWDSVNNQVIFTPVEDETGKNSGATVQSESGVQILGDLPKANETAVIQDAKQYKGVPYKFGADPYPQSRRFDCSSFTQYIFKKHGIRLPRTAREQGKVGHRVSIKNLQKGDLLFFVVPGRFNTNRIVGHVGIYTGNGNFIHTYGEPGVTINSIKDPYWKDTFLFAKRVTR